MPRKNPLDKAAVVQAAADLLNREGLEALTLNRLAGNWASRPPRSTTTSTAWQGCMHELALLNLRRLAERLGAAAMGRSGAEGLHGGGGGLPRLCQREPGLYLSSLRASGNQSTPDAGLQAGEERVVRVVLAMLDSLGLSGADAIHAARALRSAVHGFATLEIAGGFGLRLDLDESFAAADRDAGGGAAAVRGIRKPGCYGWQPTGCQFELEFLIANR